MSGLNLSDDARARFSRVKVFFCDVDGVLTDASIFIGSAPEVKRFHIRDGLGMQLLQKEGIPVAWVSFRPSPSTKMRANELKIDYLIQQKHSKVEGVESVLRELNLTWDDACFVGDDVVDLGAMKRAGASVATADAIDEARAMAHYVTSVPGGHGAIREVVELILKSQGKWDALIARYSE